VEAGKQLIIEDMSRTESSDFDSLAGFDMHLATPLPRSLRLNGKATCLRLERIYWSILEYAAFRRNEPVNMLLAHLDREVQLHFGRVINFSSLVRVVSVAEIAKACPGLQHWLSDGGEHE
jgi:predicted DNA-binding ribbon-helix-helix protein